MRSRAYGPPRDPYTEAVDVVLDGAGKSLLDMDDEELDGVVEGVIDLLDDWGLVRRDRE